VISVCILTYNEEASLPGCLVSVAWADDIVVFDSGSTDRTCEIANAHGARVVQRVFDDYAGQRNAALAEVRYTHPWLLMLDADERATPELYHEMAHRIASSPDSVTLFRLRRKDMLHGRWLRRSSGYPTWFGRLIKIGEVWVEREINEEFHTSGCTEAISEHLLHFPFEKGLAFWLERHVRYARMEAIRIEDDRRHVLAFTHVVSRDPVMRRKALKQILYRLPFRPAVVFVYLFVIRGGFLDGRPGFQFSSLRRTYEGMIEAFRRDHRMQIASKLGL
jgi:glycosyltransferase involved in cell wall biosynthesis